MLLFIYNDHGTSFFFDHCSALTLGVGDRWAVADEGAGARDLPAFGGDPAFAEHLGRSLMADEFDMSFFQDRPPDHGCFSPLSMLAPHEGGWPTRLVPLQVGVLQFPIPTARRCFRLGQALRRAVESDPEPLRVAIVATGGLSHQVHGERAGFNNPEWDQPFLDLFERDPERLAAMTHAEFAELGGVEGAEVIMWLVMRGALSAQVRCAHRSYYLPSMTGIATAIYENQAIAPTATELQRLRTHADAQLAGAERLAGTYPDTIGRSVRAYRLNRFLHALIEPAARAAFKTDPEAAFDRAALTETERDLVRRLDWRGLIHYGVIFFMLEKLGAVVGVSNLHIYAALRRVCGARFDGEVRFVSNEPPLPTRKPIGVLFSRGYASMTLALWVTYFMGLLVIYLLTGWLPTLMKDNGLPIATAANVTAMFQIGGTIGAVIVGWAMDRVQPTRVIGAAYLAGGLCVLAVGAARPWRAPPA